MNSKWNDGAALRVLAEKTVSDARRTDPGMSRDKLVHELLVHQTELEMQNEALIDVQAQLATSRALYMSLFEQAPIGYLIADRSSRIKVVNECAAELLGALPAKLVDMRFSQFLQPEDAVGFERYRREVVRTSARLAAEFTIKDARGHLHEVRLDSVCTDPDSGEWRIALTEVTTQNAIKRQLDHGERLGALGRHASGVAHNLNNLLYSILGYADVARECLEPEAPAYSAVTRLGEIVKRGVGEIDALTTFSRAEAAEPSIADLNATIGGMESVIRTLLGNDIALELSLTASDAAVRLDASHLEQIVLNSVRNARQAMPQGGTFFIETASIELSGPSQVQGVTSTRCVRWTMSDTGLGMTESTRQRAFEPFFTTKAPGVGTGLGLSMVKAAVERAGGVAAIESELGRGTSLIIHLPRATGSFRSAPEADAVESRPFASVMVVEDDPVLRARVAVRLRSAGCDVVEAGSSAEALDLLGRLAERLSVLLVDQTLPGVVIGEFIRASQVISPALEVIVAPLDEASGSTSSNGHEPPDTPLEEALKKVLSAATRLNAQ
jgi:PAS domain S-box-containing protein